jgi:hypothetical protein
MEDSMPNNPSGNYFVGGSAPVDNGSQSVEVVKTLSELKEAGINASLQAMRAQMHKFANNHPEGDSIDLLRSLARWVRNGGINPPDESSVSGVFGKLFGENAGLFTPGSVLVRSIKSKKTVDLAVKDKFCSSCNSFSDAKILIENSATAFPKSRPNRLGYNVNSEKEMLDLYGNLSKNASPNALPVGKTPDKTFSASHTLKDGTTVQLRDQSNTGGLSIDVYSNTKPNNRLVVHIKPDAP